jgi:HSP20 family molecular chaperone IbpA
LNWRGVSAEDVQIDVQGNVLYIAGSRKDRSCGGDYSFIRWRSRIAVLRRTLKFPASIEGATLEHNFENGLLLIRLKKAV